MFEEELKDDEAFQSFDSDDYNKVAIAPSLSCNEANHTYQPEPDYSYPDDIPYGDFTFNEHNPFEKPNQLTKFLSSSLAPHSFSKSITDADSTIDLPFPLYEARFGRRAYSVADLPSYTSPAFFPFYLDESDVTKVGHAENPFLAETEQVSGYRPAMTQSRPARRHSVAATTNLFICPWSACKKVFGRFSNLRSHYRTHSGERPYECNYCEATFARNHDLKRHERSHGSEKPFTCGNCSKSFARNDALGRHSRLSSCGRLGNSAIPETSEPWFGESS